MCVWMYQTLMPCLKKKNKNKNNNGFRYQGSLDLLAVKGLFDLKKILCIKAAPNILLVLMYFIRSWQLIHVVVQDSMRTFPILSISHHTLTPPKEAQG